jgi:hypothetical protein
VILLRILKVLCIDTRNRKGNVALPLGVFSYGVVGLEQVLEILVFVEEFSRLE